MAFGGFEQILFRPNITLQRHDDLLANRIDGGIGNLREKLPEVIVNHSRLIAKTGKCGIITH